MSNYISLNAKYYKNTDYKHIYDHDLRHSNVTYRLNNTQYKNFNYEFVTFEDLRSQKAQILAKKGTKEQGKENTIVEFVAALSREETEKILKEKNGYDKLNNALKSTMENISKKYGFTSLFYAFHGDEGFKNNDKNAHNFHAHLCFYNFDFEKERSVLRTIKKDEWGKMQDLAAQCFKSCGLDYVRGEKKVEKAKDHLERKYFIGAKKLAVQDINLYVKNTTQEIINNSTEKSFLQDKINPLLLKQNLHRELLKALKYDVLPQSDKDKIKKFDELKLQNEALKKEVNDLQEIKKVAQTMIQDFENIEDIKKDLLRAEQANGILHKKLEEKDEQIEKLEKKMSEQNTTIYNLNNQIQAQKMSQKNKDRER